MHGDLPSKGRKYFFFEKKKQKTFARCWARPVRWTRTEAGQSFFSKKNRFLGLG
jgi:hypothetical protein